MKNSCKRRYIATKKSFNPQKSTILIFSMLIALALSMWVCSMFKFCFECKNINNSIIRLHIIANSDSAEDQQLKLKIRDAIVNDSYFLFENSSGIDQALQTISLNTEKIKHISEDVSRETGYDYPIDVSVVNMYFPLRKYDNLTLPSGYYDALRITIGSGRGQNWWCVIYPCMCVPAACSDADLSQTLGRGELDIIENYDKYKVKFKFLEFLQMLGF
ncbi:MAG: stage II sporulation protein R [Clostridia bacterium]|nr:stage II sporulation protein R [Clostridia bacterium]